MSGLAGPDVRAGMAGLDALWIDGVQMSGQGARDGPDVRAFGRMSGLKWFSFGYDL